MLNNEKLLTLQAQLLNSENERQETILTYFIDLFAVPATEDEMKLLVSRGFEPSNTDSSHFINNDNTIVKMQLPGQEPLFVNADGDFELQFNTDLEDALINFDDIDEDFDDEDEELED